MSHAVRTSLQVNRAGDRSEQEADRTADTVMRDRTPRVAIQRRVAEEERERPQVTPSFEESVGTMRGQGQSLDRDTRALMETRFGHDFSRVRVHADARAAEMSGAIQARAFTLGSDIFFGAGTYRPRMANGQRLLAHELTHVVQQRGSDSANRDRALIVQRDLATETRAKDKGLPDLDETQIKQAIAYNKDRFAGLDKDARNEVLRTIEDLVGRPRETPALDETLVEKIAQWQSWFNLPVDGKMTPLTARTMAHELRRGFQRAKKAGAEKRIPGYEQQTASKLGSLEKTVAASAFTPGATAKTDDKWSPPSDVSKLRAEMGQDIDADGKKAFPRWVQRAYTIRFGSLDEGTKSEYLGDIAIRLSDKGGMNEAMEVLSLISIEDEKSRGPMSDTLKKIGSNAAKDAESSRQYLRALLKLVGVAEVDAKDTQVWLEKNTQGVAKAIRALEGILGPEAALDLITSVLLSAFQKDFTFSSDPGTAGSVAKLKKEKGNSKLLADCDVYATYGARLGREMEWKTVGYFAFQGASPTDIAHAIALLRRDVGAEREYLVLDSEASGMRRPLGKLKDDEEAKKKADQESGKNYTNHYFAPALADGSFPPRLIVHNPTELRYTPP